MNKGIFLVLVVLAGVGFVSGCQKKAVEEQTVEISAPVEGMVSAPEEASAQIQIAQPQIQASAPVAVPETAPAQVFPQARTQEWTPPAAEEIQQALKNAGLYEGEVDGKIGPKTNKAIEEFQAKNNLIVDGKVGRKTWEKMKEYLNMAAVAPQEVGN